jgi:XTP/dITP diphosphohydrolase
MSLANPAGEIVATAEGTVEGRIIPESRGDGGFGYDPIFLPEGSERTLAELTAEEKNALSHRGRALRVLRPRLLELL